MNQSSKDGFLKLSSQGNLVPVYREISGDLETPVSAYLKLAQHSKYSFLLESVEGEEKFARFSFIACGPQMIVRSKGNQARILRLVKGKFIKECRAFEGSPLSIARDLMKDYRPVESPDLPRFYGGMVGYLSYDCARFFERLPDKTKDDLGLDDMVFILAKDLVIFDHRHHTIKVVSCVDCGPKESKPAKIKKYNAALKKIDALIRDLCKPLNAGNGRDRSLHSKVKVKSNTTPAQFAGMVNKAKEHIHAGDIIQGVLSQRFAVNISVPPFEIYRRLRTVNPSPYMFYLNLDGLQLAGASPELLVRCESGLVETRPIAGTRPRGTTEAQDAAFKNELLADPKEKAEHVMLVDLGRNDLGRVCQDGSVKVTDFMSIEKYSHVMHIVSNVQGKLRKDKDALDVLEASFPAGTVSGAPKIRAMEIIEDLEGVRRGAYAGSVGYFSFSKNLDMCITIRTIVVRGKTAYVQAGAGIVADSDPAKEYTETVNKAKAQIKAIELAHGKEKTWK
ncbi:MAG: anthranilate synthase component I [Candidatus Omnitrophica bacterium]|nr:anthranilate synthase component I [Candidatus Omnitrophota bacterium]